MEEKVRERCGVIGKVELERVQFVKWGQRHGHGHEHEHWWCVCFWVQHR